LKSRKGGEPSGSTRLTCQASQAAPRAAPIIPRGTMIGGAPNLDARKIPTAPTAWMITAASRAVPQKIMVSFMLLGFACYKMGECKRTKKPTRQGWLLLSILRFSKTFWDYLFAFHDGPSSWYQQGDGHSWR